MQRWLWAISGLVLVAGSLVISNVAVAQFDCSRINPENCPSLFVKKCEDTEYQTKNVEACFAVLTGTSRDAEYCLDPEIETLCRQADECDNLEDPEQYFCRAGQSRCKTSIPSLLGEYDDVLQGLDVSLSRYSALTNLNLDEATSIEVLCKYQIGQLDDLRKQAESELSDLQSSEDGIDQIDKCASTMEDYIDSGGPPDLPAELWDQIARVLVAGLTDINRTRGVIQSRIDALNEAPAKLSNLRTAYKLICPEPA